MNSDVIVSLIPPGEMHTILPLVKTLNPGAEDAVLASRLREMVGQGYQCAGAYVDKRLVGISGLWVTTRFYCGKQIEPDNVVVDGDYRSHGIGQKLMAWVYDYARSLGCETCELNAYITNPRSHKFYFNEGFAVLGFHFEKRLDT